MTGRPPPPSSAAQADMARARQVAALTLERWPALSTLTLEHRHHIPIPDHTVPVDDRPHLQERRRHQLLHATRRTHREKAAP